jgi:hypothetical protein
VLIALFALNPLMLRFVDSIVADLPFLLASTGAVLLTGRFVVDGRRLISPVWDHVLLGAAMAAAFLFRANGALLLVTLAASQGIALVTRARRDASSNPAGAGVFALLLDRVGSMRYLAMSALPYVAFAALALTWRLLLPEGGLSGQKAIFSGISLATITGNINLYADMPAGFFESVPHSRIIFGTTVPLAIAGAAGRLKCDYHVIVYLALTIVMYILWPTTGGIRYIFPIFPFYLSFVVSSIEQFVGRSAQPAKALRAGMCAVPVCLVLLYFVADAVAHASQNLARSRAVTSGPFVETSRSLFHYVTNNTNADAVVLFFKPRLMTLMTGRRSLKLFSLPDLSRGDYLCLYRPDEVLDQVLPGEVACMVDKGLLERVYANPDFVAYRLLKSDQAAWRTIEGCALPRTSQ